MDAIFAALEALKDSAREQVQPAQQPAAQTQPAPAAPKPPPVRVQTPAAAPAAHAAAPVRATGLLQGMFEDGNSLLRAVIAAEVLGPPAALREPGLWNQQPNEPSISAS